MTSQKVLRAALFACIAVAALGHSIRGVTEAVAAMGAEQLVEKKDWMLPYLALIALCAVPTISFYCMLYPAKNRGWWGAFGMICCIITTLFVYFSVIAFM